MNNTVVFNGRTIELSNTNKLYFPKEEITKGDLIGYYRRMADIMLPYLRQRPLTMQRFPSGIEESGFYQKEAADYFPQWIERVMVPVESEAEDQPQVVCNDAASLVYLANQGCITPHVWLSRVGNLDYPDRLIFDLDPPDDNFELVRTAALKLRETLEAAGLVPFVMTTGSRGLHVTVPLDGEADFDTVRAFARRLADQLAEQEPEQFTTETRKAGRGGRLFLDYLRNAFGQTAVAPYAVRARPGAPIATPLDWDELGRSEMNSRRYHLRNIFQRLGQKEDPWREMAEHKRPLPESVTG